jgi:hypothetical protein
VWDFRVEALENRQKEDRKPVSQKVNDDPHDKHPEPAADGGKEHEAIVPVNLSSKSFL